MDYSGVRVRTQATVDGARVPIQIDVGFGDIITPAPVEIDYPALLDSPAPRIRAYPAETVVAEKFEAMVVRGMANSRLKDFYDLWLISRSFAFDQVTLSEAIRRTFERRTTPLPQEVPTGLTAHYATQWNPLWKTFLTRERMKAAPHDLAAVVGDLSGFLFPLISTPIIKSTWPPGGPWLIH